MKCCLCNEEIEGFGNNSKPIKTGVCCNKCNITIIIPERLKRKIEEQDKSSWQG